jgi:hyperosmotically inducible periplasmic protein
MASARAEKCAHPVCSCLTTSGRYCSTDCEAMEKTPDIDCTCGHTGCEGNRRSIASSSIHIPSRIHHRMNTRKLRLSFAMLTLFAGGILAGCFATATKSPDVSDSIRKSLDEVGFKDVSVSQDRNKGIVTLGGQVGTENDKSQAESLAKSLAGRQVVADQIAVIPIGAEKEAKAVNSDLDTGIEKNLDAALIQNKLHDNVKYEVKSGVVTLTGGVNSQSKRDYAESVAARVPNVKQVVNDLQVKNQKASSSQ